MIEVRGLTKFYGEQAAVSDLSFTVRPGIVTGFLGPNGAGKPITELGHSLLARQADCRSLVRGHLLRRAHHPGIRVCQRSATRC
jgi:ABC-2 type transport system ATP-binding protein